MSEMIVKFHCDERGIARSWDAVGELVRCKDCKHWRFDHTCQEHSLVSPMLANDFCSRAERRQ